MDKSDETIFAQNCVPRLTSTTEIKTCLKVMTSCVIDKNKKAHVLIDRSMIYDRPTSRLPSVTNMWHSCGLLCFHAVVCLDEALIALIDLWRVFLKKSDITKQTGTGVAC